MRRIVHAFFACDDNYVKYTYVTINSLIVNSNKNNNYHIHILYTYLKNEKFEILKKLEKENVKILFDDVSKFFDGERLNLHVRDYYTLTTYYRFFIPVLYPKISKALYLDSDVIILDDVAKIYDTNIKGYLAAAVADQFPQVFKEGETYVETVVGVPKMQYFNAGVLLMNVKEFRKQGILEQFTKLSDFYYFKVAQDQDYLNVLLQGKVLFLDSSNNEQVGGRILNNIDNIKIIHYNQACKPWNYKDMPFADKFWEYAKDTPFYDELIVGLNSHDEKKIAQEKAHGESLFNAINEEIENEDGYLKKKAKLIRNQSRIDVLNKRKEYELAGKFDVDLEEDPEGRELLPDEIDYLREKRTNKIKTRIAFAMARRFLDKLIDEKQIIIKEIKGLENIQNLNSGAIITCNHFNALDSFAIQLVHENSNHRDKKFYRIIKEGNYTSFPGFYGFLMKNCNTLPLSSNKETMKKFMKSVKKILADGNYILIYPEQAMWWNYRKPRPLKTGGFTLAVSNKVPVLPVFITMSDSNIIDGDGFFVQEYTINICPPIYQDPTKSRNENVEMMKDENFRMWKEIYEDTYKVKLDYSGDLEQ